MVEAGSRERFTCPQVGEEESPDLSGYNLAHLPMFSVDSRDVIGQTVYVGKAVLKEMYWGR